MDHPPVDTACPRCASSATVPGDTTPGEEWAAFRPRLPRSVWYWLFQFNSRLGVHTRRGFRACLGCGLVYAEVDPAALREFMVRENCDFPAEASVLNPPEVNASAPGD